jgi:arginyl-tRNA synthetase
VKRIKAAVAAMTGEDGAPTPFEVKLVQMVQLLRDGEPVKMSKRAGTFVTLADVVREVGKDVVRFTMLTRKPEAQMDFDFAKVVEASKDNPVFYVQYAHARICSTLRKAATEGLAPAAGGLDLLGEEELALVAQAAQFPRVVEAAAAAREPHRVAFFLGDLAAAFHGYWNLGNDRPDKRFIIGQSAEVSRARLFLAAQIGQVVRNGLALLGVEAVEEM